jgi:hypothetical protein
VCAHSHDRYPADTDRFPADSDGMAGMGVGGRGVVGSIGALAGVGGMGGVVGVGVGFGVGGGSMLSHQNPQQTQQHSQVCVSAWHVSGVRECVAVCSP